jgi:hypothetical protein
MSLDYFRIERGLILDELVSYLQGTGVPGLTGDTDDALSGSVYTDTADGSLYTKLYNGTGTAAWQKMASETYVNNAVGATISWREPAQVRDNVSTTVPAGTATQPIVVDGVSITNGGRVLFSAVVGGNGKNVYVYNQATGLFVEDTNAESNGDAAYVIAGTSAGKTYVYNGAAWVQSDQASLDEEGYIRAYIGKPTAGSVAPLYTSTNFVVQSSNLTAAVSALDLELGANVTLGYFIDPTFKVNGNIQALDNEIGANVTAGSWISPANAINQNLQALDTHLGVPFAAGNFITSAETVSAAVTALDVQFGPNVVNGNFIFAATKTNQNIQALDSEIGAQVASTGVILSTNSINQNISALATELAKATTEVTVTNVTSVQTIDSATGRAAKWLVRVELVSDVTRSYATEVFVLGDGANASDFTRYATLRLGTAIPGLVVSADSVAGVLRLRVASTGAVNVTTRRVGLVD